MTSLKAPALVSLESGLTPWKLVSISLFKQTFSQDTTQKQLEEKAKLETYFYYFVPSHFNLSLKPQGQVLVQVLQTQV